MMTQRSTWKCYCSEGMTRKFDEAVLSSALSRRTPGSGSSCCRGCSSGNGGSTTDHWHRQAAGGTDKVISTPALCQGRSPSSAGCVSASGNTCSRSSNLHSFVHCASRKRLLNCVFYRPLISGVSWQQEVQPGAARWPAYCSRQ